MDGDSIVRRGGWFDVSLYLMVYRGCDGYMMAYCPSLDLSASGRTAEEALSSFNVTLELHLEYCVEHGTLEDDLASHGWRRSGGTLRQPSYEEVAGKPEVKGLFLSNVDVNIVAKDVRIPALA